MNGKDVENEVILEILFKRPPILFEMFHRACVFLEASSTLLGAQYTFLCSIAINASLALRCLH